MRRADVRGHFYYHHTNAGGESKSLTWPELNDIQVMSDVCVLESKNNAHSTSDVAGRQSRNLRK